MISLTILLALIRLFMNQNTERYYQSALSLNLPVILQPDIDGFEIRLGGRHYYFRSTRTPFNRGVNVDLANNKYCTTRLLDAAGYPVPKGVAFNEEEYKSRSLDSILEGLHFPLVVKPTVDTRRGDDVLCNINLQEQLHDYLNHHFHHHEFITIEEFHANLNSYRVLVFRNKVIGVVLRFAAYVIGDGIHTIDELIELSNTSRLAESDILKPIERDEECFICLNELGLTLDDVPKQNQQVRLGYATNTSRGGTVRSLGRKMSKANEQYFVKAARVLNLELAGFDVLCRDIYEPFESSKGVIIEVNHSPSIRIHEEFSDDKPICVTKTIVKSLIYRHPIAYLSIHLKHRTAKMVLRASLVMLILVPLTMFASKHILY